MHHMGGTQVVSPVFQLRMASRARPPASPSISTCAVRVATIHGRYGFARCVASHVSFEVSPIFQQGARLDAATAAGAAGLPELARPMAVRVLRGVVRRILARVLLPCES